MNFFEKLARAGITASEDRWLYTPKGEYTKQYRSLHALISEWGLEVDVALAGVTDEELTAHQYDFMG